MVVVEFLLGLLVPLGFLAALVLIVRKATGHESGGVDGSSVRRFFQYLLAYGLFVIVAVGLSTLLGRLLGSTELVRSDQANLARGLTFTAIGIPLYVLVAAWSRRNLESDPDESASLGFTFYIGAASITALSVAMFAWYDVLSWATGLEAYDGDSLARLLVWTGALAAHWMIESRFVPPRRAQVHHLVGSIIGLGTAAIGVVAVIAAAIEILMDSAPVAVVERDPVLSATLVVMVGAPVWFLYWVRTTLRAERTPLWSGYVLLVGVAGGLVVAIGSASTLIYEVAVWLIGEPTTTEASRHFNNLPETVAGAAVGLVVWWYHQAVLDDRGLGQRTEVRRIYEYLMAAIGLLAAAGGVTTVMVAVIEAFAGPGAAQSGSGAVNTLLAAVTLLVVGGPVWWIYWRLAQNALAADPEAEHAAPTRRIYLFVLFGVGGVAAVVALLTGVFIFFEDIFEGVFGSETVRGMRFSIGVLVTTGAIAAYHWSVYRSDRQVAPPTVRGPRYLLVVGQLETEARSDLARRTGGKVEIWNLVGAETTWTVDEVMTSVDAFGPADEVLVVVREGRLEAVAVNRTRG